MSVKITANGFANENGKAFRKSNAMSNAYAVIFAKITEEGEFEETDYMVIFACSLKEAQEEAEKDEKRLPEGYFVSKVELYK